ncbi:hypothetical protein D3C78_799140 [compost metagenome]
MHVDQVGAGVEVIAPDFLEDHHPGDHLAGVAHEEFQQLVLGGQQVEGVLAAPGLVADQVKLQVADLQAGLRHRYAVAPQQHFNAGGHFIGGKWLGQVVVTAGT